MLKVKHLRTADCVVGGFRYESGSRHVGSLLLGLIMTTAACSTMSALPQPSLIVRSPNSPPVWKS